ncbi:XRE family transcriptional regulator [Ramlibacter sp. MAHUQ-53]|uniref:XRE family transcriptional regulator n=1 Tax=unclassified Ramlibacter TaxID=2617605 RepID=UPI003631C0CF
MSKASPVIEALPSAAAAALRRLGGDLGTARKRRKQSLKDWALRLGVSVPTLSRMEKGDPSVSAGLYATALWMMGRHEALGGLADPAQDLAALEHEVNEARARYRRG